MIGITASDRGHRLQITHTRSRLPPLPPPPPRWLIDHVNGVAFRSFSLLSLYLVIRAGLFIKGTFPSHIFLKLRPCIFHFVLNIYHYSTYKVWKLLNFNCISSIDTTPHRNTYTNHTKYKFDH